MVGPGGTVLLEDLAKDPIVQCVWQIDTKNRDTNNEYDDPF